jgi:hypothetical protein
MVLVVPCGGRLAKHCSISYEYSGSRRAMQPSGIRSYSRKENKAENFLICDRRSAVRCLSVATENTVVNGTQSNTSEQESPDRSPVLIRLVEPSELEEVAWLRAEAYYEVGFRSFRSHD